MPWTEFTRRDYERSGRRYASDTTDEEWAQISPFMPARKRTGRPRTATEQMALLAAAPGLAGSLQWGTPAGPSIVVAAALIFAASLTLPAFRR